MGQQQLLLLVLGIVIVGLAVVVGIQAFGENQKKANSDALVNDGVRIASDAQAWALKPAAFGGGANSFTGIDFADLGYDTNTSSNYANLNGTFSLSESSGTVTITGCSLASASLDNKVVVTVTGFTPNDIATVVSTSTSGCPS